MKSFFSTLLVFLSFATLSLEIDAARLGGGGSSGRQSSSASRLSQSPAPRPNMPQSAPMPQPQPSGMSRWLGPLAGVAAGFGLASLFSGGFGGGGMGGAMGSLFTMLLVGVGIFLLFNLLRRKASTGQPVQYAGGHPQEPFYDHAQGSSSSSTGYSNAHWPADFDAAEFERQSLFNFHRLQAANDAGDLSTLRDFLTPALYHELETSLQSTWGVPQKTEVFNIHARVLEVVTEGLLYVVSVQFQGQVRENGVMNALNEIWNLEKPVNGHTGWRVSGIQQAG